MSVIRQQDFDCLPLAWAGDPTVSARDKKILKEMMQLAEYSSPSDAMLIDDDCFVCGEKLTLPYVYWHGSGGDNKGKSISLHHQCARHLAKGITQDADAITNSSYPSSL
jgi:hypothetical protein